MYKPAQLEVGLIKTPVLILFTTSILFLVSAKKCSGFGGFMENCNVSEKWTDLRTTYNLTTVWSLGLSHWIDSTHVPGKLNRTTTLPRNSTCRNKIGSATYFGHRVNQDADNAVVVLYDNNGIVAGVQVRFRQDEVLRPGNVFKYSQVPMFQNETIDGILYYVLTAYFVEPGIICEAGRTADELNRLQGNGSVLYFQNGPSPSDHLVAPLNKDDALNEGYSENECYPGMGYHSFPNMSSWNEENCELNSPIFLLHNHCGSLIGFGFLWIGNSTSDRFEHPSPFGISAIIGAEETPQCLVDAANKQSGGAGLSSMHIWFVDRNPGCSLTELVSHLTRAATQYIG